MAKEKSALAKHFDRAEETSQHRTVASLEGEVGTGKTYFALTAAEPIIYHDIDLGAEGVIDSFVAEGKEIYHEKYVWIPGDPDDVDEDESKDLQGLAVELRDKFLKNFEYGRKHGARTQVVDTESRFWQAFRYAEFGSPKGDNPRDFDELNMRFESFIVKAKATPGMNLLVLRSMKDKWGMYGKTNAQGKKSFGKGGREVWGYEHLPSMMFTELTFKHLTEDDPLADKEYEGTRLLDLSEYAISFGKCRHNASLQFTTIPRCTFPELGEMLVSGSSQEDWL